MGKTSKSLLCLSDVKMESPHSPQHDKKNFEGGVPLTFSVKQPQSKDTINNVTWIAQLLSHVFTLHSDV